jgi:hypothetical protein
MVSRKSVFVVAAVLALGLPTATDTFARDGGGHGGGGHGGGGGHVGGGGGRVGGGWGGGAHFAAPHVGGGPAAVFRGPRGPGPAMVFRNPRMGVHHGPGPRFFVRGHHRHFWHGRWWAYGIGPCWAWSDDYGEYVWVCGDDYDYDY